MEVRHDLGDNILFTENEFSRRINITSSRDSLNGYQKGKCFYCRKGIQIEKSSDGDIVDVDHFFPHTLLTELPEVNINGVWNLVLACQDCNRGTGGKFERIPKIQFLERLHARNEYLINSHHPLRETIINQTGKDTPKRIKFLQQMDQKAIEIIPTRWSPPEDHEG